MANANPAKVGAVEEKVTKGNGPEIQYIGQGADKVKFEIDKNAKLIRVFGNGMVLVDY